MGNNAGAIQFGFGFDLSGLQRGAQQAGGLVNRMAAGMRTTTFNAFAAINTAAAGIGSKVGAGFAAMGKAASLAFMGIAGVVVGAFNELLSVARSTSEKLRGVFDLGRSLDALSARTNISAGRLFQFQKVMRLADVDAERLGPTINKLQVQISKAGHGAPTAVAALNAIGLTFGELKRLSPADQFLTVARNIAVAKNQAAAAVGIFGKSGGELLPLFKNSKALDDMMGPLSSQAKVFGQNAKAFREASLNLKRTGSIIGVTLNSFMVGMAGPLAQVVNDLLGKLKAKDLVEAGRKVGVVLAGVARFIAAAIAPIIQLASFLSNLLPGTKAPDAKAPSGSIKPGAKPADWNTLTSLSPGGGSAIGNVQNDSMIRHASETRYHVYHHDQSQSQGDPKTHDRIDKTNGLLGELIDVLN